MKRFIGYRLDIIMVRSGKRTSFIDTSSNDLKGAIRKVKFDCFRLDYGKIRVENAFLIFKKCKVLGSPASGIMYEQITDEAKLSYRIGDVFSENGDVFSGDEEDERLYN